MNNENIGFTMIDTTTGEVLWEVEGRGLTEEEVELIIKNTGIKDERNK